MILNPHARPPAPALFVIVDEIMIINQITHNISIKFATELCNVRV